MQDTFIKAIENIDKIKDKNKLESWIKTIAYNTAKLKYNRRKRELPTEDNSYIDFLSTDVDIDIPKNLIEEKEFSKYIMEQYRNLYRE